jgi:hypothetical protein
MEKIHYFTFLKNSGVQSINDAFHIVIKVEIVFVYTHILALIDIVEYVVYALYSRIGKLNFNFYKVVKTNSYSVDRANVASYHFL